MARSKPSTATASVRAMISVSAMARESTAALILPTISRRRNQRLVVEMAAALGKVLVLDLDRVGAGAFEQPHGALDIERVTVAGVGVDDEMGGDAVADQRDGIGDFAHADEADVRPPEPRIGDGRAGNIERLETGAVRRSAR